MAYKASIKKVIFVFKAKYFKLHGVSWICMLRGEQNRMKNLELPSR